MKMRILMLVLCLAAMATKCFSQCRKKPVILFWCSTPEKLANATFITPQVWTPQDEYSADVLKRRPEYEQSSWLKKGITPLRWMGYPHEKSEQELIDYWASAVRQGYVGIAIDEIGHVSPEVDAKAVEGFNCVEEGLPKFVRCCLARWRIDGRTFERLP